MFTQEILFLPKSDNLEARLQVGVEIRSRARDRGNDETA